MAIQKEGCAQLVLASFFETILIRLTCDGICDHRVGQLIEMLRQFMITVPVELDLSAQSV
jgi:hypothetical protein